MGKNVLYFTYQLLGVRKDDSIDGFKEVGIVDDAVCVSVA